ncbi:gluconokinase [Rhizobium pusense]|nr:gluconokinase [Agrobacterium pusense]MBW9076369.1 gluconokinase [Agrobacterium pusense]
MGVSGSGKSTIAEVLAERLGCRLLEGDDFHPSRNVEKMAMGIPLTDEDRWPWLDLIGQELSLTRSRGERLVATCSALRKSYRERLRQYGGTSICFLFLKSDRFTLQQRIDQRGGHFMPSSLLATQLALLEEPTFERDVTTVDVSLGLAAAVELAIGKLSLIWNNQAQASRNQ